MRYHQKRNRKFRKAFLVTILLGFATAIWFLSIDIPPPTKTVVKAIDNSRFSK